MILTERKLTEPCIVCGSPFTPLKQRGRARKVCSKECSKLRITELGYKQMSGSWPKYLRGLIQMHKKKRGHLNENQLIEMLERQKYKCALTGVKMTCLRAKGIKFKTNASIDRINSDLGYNIDNIQMVCSIVNGLKVDLTNDDFIEWCRKVAKYAKQNKRLQTRISTPKEEG